MLQGDQDAVDLLDEAGRGSDTHHVHEPARRDRRVRAARTQSGELSQRLLGVACTGGFRHVVRTVLDVPGRRGVFGGKELRGSQVRLRRCPTALVASQATSQIVNLGVLCSSERAIEELGDRYLGCRERTCVHEMARSAAPVLRRS